MKARKLEGELGLARITREGNKPEANVFALAVIGLECDGRAMSVDLILLAEAVLSEVECHGLAQMVDDPMARR